MQLPESAVTVVAKALTPAVDILGRLSAELAAQTLLKYGISAAGLRLDELMAIGAKARIGALAAMGFFDYVPVENGFSLAAEHSAKACRDPLAAARMKNVGLIFNAAFIDVHNFTPVYSMLDAVITADGKELDFPPVTEIKPCSEGAIRWAQELGSPLHYAPPSLSIPQEILNPLATKVMLEAIRAKELVTEEEMALLVSCPAKSLGNRRRDHEVNPSVFVQDKPNGIVWYRMAESLAAIRHNAFYVAPKPGKKSKGVQ